MLASAALYPLRQINIGSRLVAGTEMVRAIKSLDIWTLLLIPPHLSCHVCNLALASCAKCRHSQEVAGWHVSLLCFHCMVRMAQIADRRSLAVGVQPQCVKRACGKVHPLNRRLLFLVRQLQADTTYVRPVVCLSGIREVCAAQLQDQEKWYRHRPFVVHLRIVVS